jgi:hypothetical protein
VHVKPCLQQTEVRWIPSPLVRLNYRLVWLCHKSLQAAMALDQSVVQSAPTNTVPCYGY